MAPRVSVTTHAPPHIKRARKTLPEYRWRTELPGFTSCSARTQLNHVLTDTFKSQLLPRTATQSHAHRQHPKNPYNTRAVNASSKQLSWGRRERGSDRKARSGVPPSWQGGGSVGGLVVSHAPWGLGGCTVACGARLLHRAPAMVCGTGLCAWSCQEGRLRGQG